MSSATINLILGALIAIGASAATLAVVYRFQTRREERLQAWEREREREAALRAEGNAILSRRLDSIETLATQIYLWAAQLAYKLEDILSVEDWNTQPVKRIISPLMENAHLMAMADALHDSQMESFLGEYSDRIADLVAGLQSLPLDPSPESVDALMDLSAGLREPYANILRRVDELKVEGLQEVRYPQIGAEVVHVEEKLSQESESPAGKLSIDLKNLQIFRKRRPG